MSRPAFFLQPGINALGPVSMIPSAVSEHAILFVVLLIVVLTFAFLLRRPVLIAGGMACMRYLPTPHHGGAPKTRQMEMRACTPAVIQKCLAPAAVWTARTRANEGWLSIYEARPAADGTVEFVAWEENPGPYAGPLLVIDAPSNTYTHDTMMTPDNLLYAYRLTATEQYAWILVDDTKDADGAPRRFAVRAANRTAPVPLNDALRAAIRARASGEFGHKLRVRDFVEIVRAHGFDVLTSAPGDAIMRYQRRSILDVQELERVRRALMSMTEEQIMALDWSEVDTKLRPLTNESAEYAGTLAVENGRVLVKSVRHSGAGAARRQLRGAIDYHTHPSRPSGPPDTPSDADLAGRANIMQRYYLGWSVVVAAEGDYIIIVPDTTAALSEIDERAFRDIFTDVYESTMTACAVMSRAQCAAEFGARIRRMGITIMLRRNKAWPGWTLSDTGAMELSVINNIDLDALDADVARCAALRPATVAGADVVPLVRDLFGHFAREGTSWWLCNADYDARGAAFVRPARDPSAHEYTAWMLRFAPGPIMFLYHAQDAELPAAAAIAAAQSMSAGRSAWAVVVGGVAQPRLRYAMRLHSRDAAVTVDARTQLLDERGLAAAGFDVFDAAGKRIGAGKRTAGREK